MARAKRTDRAEARRRFRQQQLDEAAALDELAVDGEEAGAAVTSRARTAPPRPTSARDAGGPAPRPGLFGAFRTAATPADIRGDLRALPSLLRTRAAIVPGILILGTLVVTFALAGQRSIVAALAFQAFLAPPPMAASFLAGILTPRAGWLLGLLAGLVAGVGFVVVMLIAPDDVILGLFRADATIPPGFRESYAIQALLVSPLMGLATGAFAGFYRRFLRMASPQQPGRQASRSANRSRKAPSRR